MNLEVVAMARIQIEPLSGKKPEAVMDECAQHAEVLRRHNKMRETSAKLAAEADEEIRRVEAAIEAHELTQLQTKLRLLKADRDAASISARAGESRSEITLESVIPSALKGAIGTADRLLTRIRNATPTTEAAVADGEIVWDVVKKLKALTRQEHRTEVLEAQIDDLLRPLIRMNY